MRGDLAQRVSGLDDVVLGHRRRLWRGVLAVPSVALVELESARSSVCLSSVDARSDRPRPRPRPGRSAPGSARFATIPGRSYWWPRRSPHLGGPSRPQAHQAPDELAQPRRLGRAPAPRPDRRRRRARGRRRSPATRTPGRRRDPGAKAGARSSTAAPWAPTPGSSNTACGHQLAQRAEALGRGRAGHRADVGEPGSPTPARPARRPAPARRPLTVPPSASSRSCTSAAPGFEVRTSTNMPAPRARAASMNGASESRPSSGLTVMASAPRPATSPKGVAVRAEERLGVRRARDVDVAALGVGDDHQPVLRAQRARPRASAAHPGRPGARSRPPGA